MANFKVEIKSKDMIKPSSETPNHLKTLQLSFLDQFAPPVLMPFIFYYQTPFKHNNNNSQTSTKLLKKSLSEALVQFYPLAGRVEGNLSINCNDQGAEFYEADVFATLAEVIANPDPEELIRLLPYAPFGTNKSIVTAVQVTRFSCGSMAISVSISHKIADAATIAAFMNAWAHNARGVSSNNHPTKTATFDSASFFPPMDLNGMYDPESVIRTEKIVTRRLIFDKVKLDELKKECDDKRLGNPPSRATVVSAFFWKKFIKITRAKPTASKIFSLTQVVNLRTIKRSPIPEKCYGNLFWFTFAHNEIEPEIEYTEAIGKLRTAVKKIDGSYIPKIRTGEFLLEFEKANECFSQGEGDSCGVSSLINFPLYQVDFGWGNPIWVSMTTLPFRNTVFLISTKCGQGIEAWISIEEHDLAMLEQDHEFRSLATHRIRPKL